MSEYEELLNEKINLMNNELLSKYGKIDPDIILLCEDICLVMHSEGYSEGYHDGGTDAMNSIPNLNELNR